MVLRPWTAADLPTVAELATDPYVPLIGTVPSPYTDAGGRAYVARQHQRLADGAGWSFAVVERESGRAAGGTGLWLHDDQPATAGYVLAPSGRGRGLATAALGALTAFAATVGVETVELLVEPDNAASRAVAERAGYRAGALLPGYSEIGGRRRDVLRYTASTSGGGLVAPPAEQVVESMLDTRRRGHREPT